MRYQIATYSGEVTVNAEADADSDHIIALAKRKLRAEAGEFPFGYQSWRVVR